jgi:hypothetical protein
LVEGTLTLDLLSGGVGYPTTTCKTEKKLENL